MNPFTLPGPAFLVFFTGVCVAVIVGLVWLRHRSERGPMPKVDLADPYLLAVLRDGREEAVRVALAVLIDRRILEVREKDIGAGERYELAKTLASEVERDVGQRVSDGPRPIHLVITEGAGGAVMVALEDRLRELDLLPSVTTRDRRSALVTGGMAVIGLVALIKTSIALGSGRSNVGLLIFGAIVASLSLLLVMRPRLTTRGRRLVEDVRSLYSRLHARARTLRPGSGGSDLALLAGVFGVAYLPVGFMGATLADARPPAVRRDGGCGSSSCGSSGGSSCSGGCGGGCGGCGGD